MKWLGIISLSLVITIFLGFNLFRIFNTPVDIINTRDGTTVEMTEIEFPQHERAELEGQINSLLNEPQICQSAADCIKTHYGCPFGCSSLVNITNHKKILALKRARALTNGYGCMYRCAVPAKASQACIDNICTLVTTFDGPSNIRQFIDNNAKHSIDNF
jgi:hypothetical protein